jgi:hypothetical protein
MAQKSEQANFAGEPPRRPKALRIAPASLEGIIGEKPSGSIDETLHCKPKGLLTA